MSAEEVSHHAHPTARARVPADQPGIRLSRLSTTLFLAFAAYIVVPIYDVPLMGLSISAPIMYLIALDLFARSRIAWSRYTPWLAFLYMFGTGLLLSLGANTFAGKIRFDTSDLITLIRFAYWELAFLVTLLVVANLNLLRQVSIVLGVAVLALGGFRLFEVVVYGKWGAWTSPVFLTQNSYGILFSSFFPFGLALPFVLRGWQRSAAIIGVGILGLMILGNGSRSSWAAAGVGAALFIVLYGMAQSRRPSRIAGPALLVLAFALLVSQLPASVLAPINSRYATLQRIEEDKSYAIRTLMNQKGERLFLENPLFGAGTGRFTRSSVPLDIPRLLRYAPQAHFDVKSPHNSYIKLLGETGLAGTAPFALLLAALTLGGLRAAVRHGRRGELGAIAAYVGFISMSIHLWTLSGLTGTHPWFVYGLVAATIVADPSGSESRKQ